MSRKFEHIFFFLVLFCRHWALSGRRALPNPIFFLYFFWFRELDWLPGPKKLIQMVSIISILNCGVHEKSLRDTRKTKYYCFGIFFKIIMVGNQIFFFFHERWSTGAPPLCSSLAATWLRSPEQRRILFYRYILPTMAFGELWTDLAMQVLPQFLSRSWSINSTSQSKWTIWLTFLSPKQSKYVEPTLRN